MCLHNRLRPGSIGGSNGWCVKALAGPRHSRRGVESLTTGSLSCLPLVGRSTGGSRSGWGVVLDFRVLTPPVALFERNSPPQGEG